MRQVVSHLHYIDLLNDKMCEHPRYTPDMRAWLHPEGNLQNMGVGFDPDCPNQSTVVAWASMQLSETLIVDPPLHGR